MMYVVEQSDSVPPRAPFVRDGLEHQVAASDPLSPAEIHGEVTSRGLLVDHDSDPNGRAAYPSICAVSDEYE